MEMKRILSILVSLCMTLSLFHPINAISYEILIKGIDVSSYQGSINWETVANSGIEFAIIRCGTTNKTDANYGQDIKFRTNYQGAVNAGIPVGTYMYTSANTKSEMKSNVDSMLSTIAGCQFSYPVYIDVEQASRQTSLGKAALTEIILYGLNLIKNSGYTAGVYANQDWFNNYVDRSKIQSAGYEIWLARYPSGTYAVNPSGYDYSSTCSIWQYSSKGSVSGISGNVDVDVAYKRYGGSVPDPTSKITISGQTIPTGILKLGGNFGIYGTISSNLNIAKVWGGIYKQGTETTVQYVEEPPNARTYDLHGKFNNNLIFDNLPAGSYTYRIYAKDSQKTYTLIDSNFSVGTVDSYMSISSESIPSGSLTPGKFFAINGIIKSNLPITKVWGGVYKSDWTVTAQYAEATPNTTSYDLSKYFDSQIVFNGLAVGSYHYLIKATDTSGKEYTLINSDFQIGSVNNLEFNASTTTLDINKSKGLIKTITFSYKNAPVDRVSIQFVHGSNRITNCTWQEWSNQAIDLDFEGYKNGTEILTVNLLNAENDAVLASKTITINVTSDPVEFYASASSISVNRSKDEQKQVEFSYVNYDGGVSLSFEHGSSTHTSCSWGEWSDNKVSLTINGTSDGTETITVYMKDSDSDKVIASKTIKITVTSDEHKVSFDSNGGNCSTSSKTVTVGKAYGALPTATKTGYTFGGWTLDSSSSSAISESTIVSKTTDHTLTAIWIPNSYIVSFDLNDGTGVISSKTVNYDKAIGDFPNISVRSDCEFLGWFTEPDGGDMVTPDTKYTYETNIILYARVKENIIEPILTFELSNTDIILENGRQFHISATQDGLSYVSHNTDVAVVSRDGLITAVGEGVVVISVYNADGYEVLMIVTVIPVSDYTEGDVDGNGIFDIEDVKLLQRWLLADPDAHLRNWKAGDLCEDDRLDVFDLCMMKKILVGG